MLQNIGNLINTHYQCDVTRCVICISNNGEYLDKEQSYKNSTSKRNHIVILIDLCNAIKKIFCNWRFKVYLV